MQPRNRTRISAQGLLAPRHRLSPLQHQSPTLSKLQQLTTAPLSSHPFSPDSSGSPPEHSCHLVHLPMPPSKALVVTFPLAHSGAAAATSSPPVLSWLPPSPPYNHRHSVQHEAAGMSNRSCFPDPAESRTRS